MNLPTARSQIIFIFIYEAEMGRFSVEDDDSDDEMSVIEDTALHVVTSQMNASINSNASLNRHDRSFFEGRDDDPNADAMNEFNSHPMDHYKDHDHLEHFPVARQTKGYRKQFVFLVLLIALQHYMPPPPPSFDTWTDYVSHSTEGFKATLTNFTLLAWYIVSGCVNNMHQDGKLRIHALLSEKQGHLHLSMPCPIALPKSSDSFNAMDAIQTRIKDRIVAQDSAIELISRALILWNLGETNPGTSTNNNAAGVKRPLNMIFTGSHGVGKYEVAKQVADIMLNSCQIESFPEEFSCATPACNRDNSDRILDIAGIEYALEEENHERALGQRILDHIYGQKGAGAIVIIRHVENLSMGAKLELVRLLSKRNVIFTPTKTIDDNGFSFGSIFGMENDFRNEREVEIRLDNSVFVMTTDLGADKIFGGLRNHVFQARALHDTIQVEVEQDVKQYFGVKVSPERCCFIASYLKRLSLIIVHIMIVHSLADI